MLTYPLILLSKPVNPNFVRPQRYRITTICTKLNNSFTQPLNHSITPFGRNLQSVISARLITSLHFLLQVGLSAAIPPRRGFPLQSLTRTPFLQNLQKICNPSFLQNSKVPALNKPCQGSEP